MVEFTLAQTSTNYPAALADQAATYRRRGATKLYQTTRRIKVFNQTHCSTCSTSLAWPLPLCSHCRCRAAPWSAWARSGSEDYLSARRGDVLTTGKLSASARTALQVVGTDEARCNTNISECRKVLIASIGLSDEQRLSTISELWLQEALQNEEAQKLEPANDALKAATLSAYLESAKHAYAYLFFTSRTPDLRALEDRQAQVRDYYNFSTQQAVVGLFNRYRDQLEKSVSEDKTYLLQFDPWQVSGSTAGISLSHKGQLPNEPGCCIIAHLQGFA